MVFIKLKKKRQRISSLNFFINMEEEIWYLYINMNKKMKLTIENTPKSSQSIESIPFSYWAGTNEYYGLKEIPLESKKVRQKILDQHF